MRIINIREALLDLDRRTSGRYELTSLYEACRLDEKEKEELVKYIASYEHPSNLCGYLSSKCEGLNESCGDDEVTENEMKKIIDDINCGEDHTLWALMDKADEEDKKLTEDTNWRTNPTNSKEVSRYVYRKILPFDEFTNDDSRYWDFDRCVVEGDDAKLVDKAPAGASYVCSFVNDEVDIDLFIGRESQGDVWYVIDNKPVEEGLLDVNVPINVTANNNKVPFLGGTINEEVVTEDVTSYDKDVEFNDKYFPRININDKERYDTVEHKDKFFAYDKKDNILIYLFKDDEEISKFGFDKAPWRELDAAGLSADSWNDEEVRQDYLDEYCFNLDDETSYMVQDFIQNELPLYQQNEAVAVAERPLSSLGGTLSSVLLSHKDEVDTLYDKGAAFEFLDRITPEVKNKGYIATVKQNLLKSRSTPVEYFYNIILKGDGDGSIGSNGTRSKINRWARESLTESAPSQAMLDDCLQDYKENAFGFDGVEDYVETQFPMHADDFKKAVVTYIKGKNESVEEAIEHVYDKDGNEIEPPLGRCECGRALIAGEGEQPHCAHCDRRTYDDDYYMLENVDEATLKADLQTALHKKGLKLNPEQGTVDDAVEYIMSSGGNITVDEWIKETQNNYPEYFQEALEESDEDKPYTYKQVFDELKLETKNFTVEEGAGRYGYESEANHAVKILEKHYASVELDTVGSWFQIDFKDRLKKSVKEGLNDYRFEVTCNDGPTKVISTVAENEESAIKYVKDYYAQEHSTYADDSANKWSIKNLYDGKEYNEGAVLDEKVNYDDATEAAIEVVKDVMSDLQGITPAKDVEIVRTSSGPVLKATYDFNIEDVPGKDFLARAIANAKAFKAITGEEVDFEAYNHRSTASVLGRLISDGCGDIDVAVTSRASGLDGISLSLVMKTSIM